MHQLGVAAAASCTAFMARRLPAATSSPAKRLVIFHTPCGVHPSLWSPTRVAAADDFDFNVMNAPLAAIRDRLVLVEGLSFPSAYANHDGGIVAALTGGGPTSVDQYVARKLVDLGVQSKLPALVLGVQSNDPSNGGFVSYRDGQPVADLLGTPSDVYALAFGGGAKQVRDAAVLLAQRQRILELASGRLSALQGTVGGASAQASKIAAHLQGLQRLGSQLPSAAAPACAMPPEPGALDPTNPESFRSLGQAQMGLLVNALACDATRVATLQWSVTRSAAYFGSLDGQMTEAHHALSHERDTPLLVNQLVEIEQWYAQQFVALVNALATTPAPGASHSLLDETLVVWSRELGDGHFHTQFSVSYVLAGPRGVLQQSKNGRYLHFGGYDPLHPADAVLTPRAQDPVFGSRPTDAQLRMGVRGQRHQRLLVWLCEAMGVTQHADFGSTAPASDGGADPAGDLQTPLPGLSP